MQVQSMQDSTYTAQVEAKLKALTLSPEGARWVMKALDPVRGGPQKIPDAVQVASLCPEYKSTLVINAPSGIGTSNWDCLILLPPSDTVAAYYATNITGIDFSTSVASFNGVLNVSTPAVTSSTLTGAAVSTGGGIWTNGVVSYRVAASPELPAMWRTSARSATVYATGSDLYNQGTVYAGQYAVQPYSLGAQAEANSGTSDVVYNLDGICVPLKEADMATMTPNFYTTSAKEGVYTVHRMTGPAQRFVTATSPARWRSGDGLNIVHSLVDPTNINSFATHIPRFMQDDFSLVSPVVPPTAGRACSSTSFDYNTTWGVIIFRGLHPSMSLTLKTVVGLELVPTPAAPSRQFISPPAKYDPQAMTAYYALANELPSCMASKHNFLGTILPAISAVASKVLPFLAPMAGQALQALGAHVQARAAPPPIVNPPPAPSVRRAASVASTRSRVSLRARKRVKVKGARR